MSDKPELFFERSEDWYEWLLKNHKSLNGVYLIFYKLELDVPTMRWEEAVKVAICFGWIDSTVKSLGNGKRKQYFCSRNPKSVWSALNKKYIKELMASNLMHKSGLEIINIEKQNSCFYHSVVAKLLNQKNDNYLDTCRSTFTFGHRFCQGITNPLKEPA